MRQRVWRHVIEGKVYECSWEPEASVYKWYAQQDGDETVIYANFQGKNPNEENVEINVRRECFMPSETGIGYITVSGFNINKAATHLGAAGSLSGRYDRTSLVQRLDH